MSAAGLSISVLHNGKVHVINIDKSQNDIKIADLMQQIYSTLKIPTQKQRLIHRGKSLTDPGASIGTYHITSGDKIMLLGSTEAADPNEIQKLDDLESTLSFNNHQIEEAKVAFEKLRSVSDSTSSRKFLRTLVGISESCIKGLEKADTVYLPSNDEKQRKRRKILVDSFQVIINEVEKMQTEVEEQTKTAAVIEISK